MIEKIKFIVVLFSFLLISNNAIAKPIDDAWAAYDAGDFNKAAEIFRKLESPSPKALGALCQMAVLKRSISRSDADMKYCQDAINQKDPNAYAVMGLAYLEGNDWLGIEKNERLGLGYLGNAVILGYAVADDFLCRHYYESANYGVAAPFCKVAAASALPNGLYYLALMSVEGNGAVQDFKRGKQFALLSASMNYAPAFILLGNMASTSKYGKPQVEASYAWYLLASASMPDMTQARTARDQLGLNHEQIEKAQTIAHEWKLKAPPRWHDLY